MACINFDTLDLSTLDLRIDCCNLVIETASLEILFSIALCDAVITYQQGKLNLKDGIQALTITDAQITGMGAIPAQVVDDIKKCMGIMGGVDASYKQKMAVLAALVWSPDAATVYYQVDVITSDDTTFTDSDGTVSTLADGQRFEFEDRENLADTSAIVTGGAGAVGAVTWITYD